MTPDLSEFSYGFALTNEFVAALGNLQAAPVFPSLIEEGKTGGGYDVKLDAPGLPLYLQFKRADCMVRSTAAECATLGWVPPFYRMRITERRRSQQHDLLLSLDQAPNVVFYAAPRFHTVGELDDAFTTGTVRPRSFFIRPQAIGPLDDRRHHIAFREDDHFVCSEPTRVKGIRGEELEAQLQEALAGRKDTLRTGGLDLMLESTRRAASQPYRAPEQTPGEYERALAGRLPVRELTDRVISEAITQRDERVIRRIAGREKSPEEAKLRALADTAMKVFSAQLFIVQEIG